MLKEIEQQLTRNKDIEDILEKQNWKKFEIVVADIFKENDFLTKQNFRFKTNRRYEIDVIAVSGNKIFCVDCKWWNKGRYKKSGLKSAIVSQENRTKEFGKFLKKNPIAKSLLHVKSGCIYPLLVTLHDEDIIKFGETFVVPIWKLNRFITEF